MCPAHNGYAEYKSLPPWHARVPIIMKLGNWKFDPGQCNLTAGIMFTSLLRLYLLSISTSCPFPLWCGIVRCLSVSNPPSPIPSLFKHSPFQILSSIPSLFQRSFCVITYLCLIQFLGFKHQSHPSWQLIQSNHHDLRNSISVKRGTLNYPLPEPTCSSGIPFTIRILKALS